MLLLAAACALSSSRPPRTQRAIIDYETIGEPLRRAVANLAQKTGLKLQVDTSLQDEPVAMRVRGQPVEIVLTQIASGFDAQWATIGDHRELVRATIKVNQLDDQLRKARAQLIREQLQQLSVKNVTEAGAQIMAQQYGQLLERTREGPLTSSDIGEFRKLGDQTAEWNLLVKILRRVGADELASLGPGRYVYSVQPTPTELVIPDLSSADIDDYVAQHNYLASAITKVVPPGAQPRVSTSISRADRPLDPDGIRPILSLRYDRGSAITLATLDLYDSKGREFEEVSHRLDLAVDDVAFQAQRLKAGNGQKLRLSAPLTEIATRASLFSAGGLAPRLSASAEELLITCDKHDPVQLCLGEPLVAVAKSRGENLIATCGDDSFFPLLFYGLRLDSTKEFNEAVYELTLAARSHETVSEADGWMIVKPVDPQNSSTTRCNRHALARFMSETATNGYATLEDWAALAADNPQHPSEEFVLTMRDLLSGSLLSDQGNDWDAYRLLGSLSDAEWRALAVGDSIPLGALSNDQNDIIRGLTYGNTSTYVDTWPPERIPPAASREVPISQSIESQPTEAAPEGVPASGTLNVRQHLEVEFFVTGDLASGNRDTPMDIDALARRLAQEELPSLFPIASASPLRSLVLGKRRKIDFFIDIGQGLGVKCEMVEEQQPREDGIPIGALGDRLPADIWTRLRAKVVQCKKQLEAESHTQGVGSSSPPQVDR